jgi:transcriptional regulator with XRE-family HTH domain
MTKKPENTKQLDKRIINVAKKIKLLRVNSGYSSAESFSYDHGLSRVHYWRIEKGSNLTLESLLRILDIHQITLEDFFKDF